MFVLGPSRANASCQQSFVRLHRPTMVLIGLLLGLLTAPSVAQVPGTSGVHYPLHQTMSPGVAAQWAAQLGRAEPQRLQPVRVELPTTGTITWFGASAEGQAATAAPGTARVAVGHTYRLKLSNMPEFPGIELFPSIEVVDRLHPPMNQADRFPITLHFTEKDIAQALEGRLVTAVVYLEQPQFAIPHEFENVLNARTLPAHENAFELADRLGRPMALVRLGGRLPAAGGNDAAFFGNAAPIEISSNTADPPAAIQPNGPEPRITLPSSAEQNDLPNRYPDEYLFDGGDRGMPLHYGPFHQFGVETEDTIAEYTDHTGRRHVLPTNRVAIYAPRFAAIRSVSSPNTGTSVRRVAICDELDRGLHVRSRATPTYHNQNRASEDVRMRSRVSGLEDQVSRLGVRQASAVSGHVKLINLGETRTSSRHDRLEQTTGAVQAEGVQAALVWSRRQYPVVAASLSASQDVYASFKPEEYVGLEDEHKTTGRLKIVKSADKRVAASGDEILFTIRYENLGDRELLHVRVVDNLTPRLEFVENSATSDRPGGIVVEDNEEGSLVLRFQLDDPLPGHTGGVITFKTRVR